MQTDQHPDELLPWYVNGTLSVGERTDVEAHIGQCEQCQAEIKLLRAMQQQIKELASEPPTDMGWQRLKRAIYKDHGGSSRPGWFRPAMAAAVAIILLQSVALVKYMSEPQTVLLGHIEPGAVLQLRFAPDTTESEIRALLQDINGDFISGPGALDVYRVRLTADENDKVKIDAIIARLLKNKKIIRQVATEF